MGKNTVFTRFKRYQLLILFVSMAILLSACGSLTEPIDADSTGFFAHFVVYPFSLSLKFIANLFQGSYGISIIVMTILIRTLLMPLMLRQQKTQLSTREKMIAIQPEADEIKKKYEGKKDQQSQAAIQKETMELYQKHQFNPLTSMGCLPMIVQFPILIGFYYSIMRTPEIAETSFLWFNLGAKDLILPLVAALIYFLQFKVSQLGMDPKQAKQMAMFGYITPVLMGFFSFSVASALPLYWSVGGLFLIFQTLLFKWIYREQHAKLQALSKAKEVVLQKS